MFQQAVDQVLVLGQRHQLERRNAVDGDDHRLVTAATPRDAIFEKPSKLRRLRPEAAELLSRDLYLHQLKAVQAGINGEAVVISTSTASGKSLCYQTLAAHHLAEPGATMLYLAPFKALIVDQMDAFESFFFRGASVPNRNEHQLEAYLRRVPLGVGHVQMARYDGDVPKEFRKAIKQARPKILLTNPDMLTAASAKRSSTTRLLTAASQNATC